MDNLLPQLNSRPSHKDVGARIRNSPNLSKLLEPRKMMIKPPVLLSKITYPSFMEFDPAEIHKHSKYSESDPSPLLLDFNTVDHVYSKSVFTAPDIRIPKKLYPFQVVNASSTGSCNVFQDATRRNGCIQISELKPGQCFRNGTESVVYSVLLLVSPRTKNMQWAPCVGKLVRSLSDTTAISVEFQNCSNCHEMEVSWIDYQGAFVQRRCLAHGQKYIESSFLTHPWLLTNRNSDGQVMSELLVVYNRFPKCHTSVTWSYQEQETSLSLKQTLGSSISICMI